MGSEKLAFSAALVAVALIISAPSAIRRLIGAPVVYPTPIVTPQRILIPTNTPAPTPTPRPTRTPGTVILQAAQGNSVVQMFGSLSDDASVIATFRSGTECRKYGRLHHVTVAGVSMSFYRINCHGTGGYVNSKWVR